MKLFNAGTLLPFCDLQRHNAVVSYDSNKIMEIGLKTGKRRGKVAHKARAVACLQQENTPDFNYMKNKHFRARL